MTKKAVRGMVRGVTGGPEAPLNKEVSLAKQLQVGDLKLPFAALLLAATLHPVSVLAQTPTPSPTPTPTPVRLSEEVVVQAVRADDKTPVTKTDIGREAIELVNRGQEMPYLLGATPAVNVHSDSGIAAGYSYFNIRGIGQTWLNITLDGAPLQDPEDQALYFANFGDFASVVESIQLQRGVGMSGVGSASYGGSVNFASVGPGAATRLEAQAGGGSWGSGRGTLALSGPVGGGFGLYGRFSAQTTDGFRRHSGIDQQAGYFGATRIYPINGEGFRAITEFPMFSFLLGDLHPHVMSLPFVLLAVGLALTLFMSDEPLDIAFWLKRPLLLVVSAVMLGGLAFINTWDIVTFAFVLMFVALIRNWMLRPDVEASTRRTLDSADAQLLTVLAAILLGASALLVVMLMPSPLLSKALSPSRSVFAPSRSPTKEISAMSEISPSPLRSSARKASPASIQPVRSAAPSPSMSKRILLSDTPISPSPSPS